MKDLEKLEDCRLPEVGSEKVKKCMQVAVERAMQLQKENDEAGEHYTITVGNFPKIFHTLSDCDFRNEECVNNAFKMIIDRVFDDITAHEVLGILNDAYAIAIDAVNTEYPEYEVPHYCRIANTPPRSADEKAMVMGFAAFIFEKLTKTYTVSSFFGWRNRDDNYKVTDKILESTDSATIFYNICEDIYDTGDIFSRARLTSGMVDYPNKKQIIDNHLNGYKYDDIYDFLDAIVRYAEALPADEWSAVRVIGRMLHAKGAAGRYIPSVMYREYEQRIDMLANCPKPEQGEAPLPAPHPGVEVQEEEPQEVLPAAPVPNPVPEPSTQKERIKAAISRLLDKRKEEGEKFCAKHWYAVYRVLAWRELVAENMKAFAELMNEMGFSDCKRSNLNSAQKEQKLPAKISEWFGRTRYQGGDKKLADVAQVFLSILREDNL
jgi:hypothetical protein